MLKIIIIYNYSFIINIPIENNYNLKSIKLVSFYKNRRNLADVKLNFYI